MTYKKYNRTNKKDSMKNAILGVRLYAFFYLVNLEPITITNKINRTKIIA